MKFIPFLKRTFSLIFSVWFVLFWVGCQGRTRNMKGLGAPMVMSPMAAPLPAFSFQNSRAEEYARIEENEFHATTASPLSTFSIDVDTASYANCRRMLRDANLPPPDAVRIEEFINYFPYAAMKVEGVHPIASAMECAACPWQPDHDLLMVHMNTRPFDLERAPQSNLVFLVDVSGSMQSQDKLPLLKNSLRLLVAQLRPEDRVAIVTYAGSSGLALKSTPGNRKKEILARIEAMEAGGSTAGGAGIQLAYQVARENFIKGGNNRILLATDGDFNVGVSDTAQLTRRVESEREHGVALSVLGFGSGNLKDSRMESLADHGNGNYAYIDSILEARKSLVTEMGGTFFTVAKDVKIQIEFNPAQVKAYRLVGYENRLLENRDFNDDQKDAGELGAGHQVTAFYELIRNDGTAPASEGPPAVDPLKYQTATLVPSSEICTLKIRYKKPDGQESHLMEQPALRADIWTETPSDHFQFASCVAEFGLLLRNSTHKGQAGYDRLLARAQLAKGPDENGYRAEFIELAKIARDLPPRPADRD